MATTTKKPERLKFAATISALAATFGREMDEATIQCYWLALDDLQQADINRAVKAAMKTCKFMPSGRELRELAGVMSPESRAVVAWEQFERAVALHGYYDSINFDDAVINATVRNLGGWEKVCCLEGDEFSKWLRKDFERVYVSLMQNGISAEQAAPLIGHSERQNRSAGYLTDGQLLLGNGEQKPLQRIEYKTGLPPHADPRLRIGVQQQRVTRSQESIPRVEFKKASS